MPRRYSIFVLLTMTASVLAAQSFRPSAVPLVTHDPYFSLWSMDDLAVPDQEGGTTSTQMSDALFSFLLSVPANRSPLTTSTKPFTPTIGRSASPAKMLITLPISVSASLFQSASDVEESQQVGRDQSVEVVGSKVCERLGVEDSDVIY